jgi:hypothetical protein
LINTSPYPPEKEKKRRKKNPLKKQSLPRKVHLNAKRACFEKKLKLNNGQAPNSIFHDRKRPVAKLNRQEGRKSRQKG